MKKFFVFILGLLFIATAFHAAHAQELGEKLKGRIVLQVQSHGEAWYINPATAKRHYMANGQEAYNIMRELGVGVTNDDLARIKANSELAKKHSGKIFLQVEEHGEAYYIDFDGNAHYLKDGEAAYNIMRDLGLGITNPDLEKIAVAGEYYPVVKVVDGDTIDIEINGEVERLRLIGLDTPETVDPRKPVECFGKEASNKAKELLTGQSVRLESDPTQGERDKYNRLLRYVYLEDGTLFNKKMISEGYGHEYTYNIPYKYMDEFKAAEDEARENERGLWNQEVCSEYFEDMSSSEELDDSEVADSSSGKWYTSGHHSAVYYYCESDPAWKGLSENYLEEYDSLEELLKVYPHKTLHESCE